MSVAQSVRGVHLVGSIPLESAEAVFDLVGSRLGGLCARVPDGETGPRANWIGWQLGVFARQAALVRARAKEREYQLHPPFVFKPDRGAGDLDFGALGFGREAIRSHAVFADRQRRGAPPLDARFLVALPTPFAPVYSFTGYAIQEAVYPVYESAVLAELDRICEAIPPDRLAIQWDVATEMSIFEKVHDAPFEDAWDVLIDRLAALGDRVPGGVEMGYHLCYGSMNNRHWKEPADLAMCVAVANALAARLARPIQFLHMPVPVDRADDAYYAPLRELALAEETELFLGLVHDGDGLAGSRARMAAAARFRADFGIAAECGLGRRDPADVPALLALHAAVAGAR